MSDKSRKLMVRIMCLVLAILMVFGGGAAVINMIVNG